jgi:farnesyl-diphosphate farnesyltransferase
LARALRLDPARVAGLADAAFGAALLPRVSRTFAACIRLLPQPTRDRVLNAYLLCRIADTIEDTADLPLPDKQRLLAHFRACLDEGGPDAAPLAAAFAQPRSDDELLTREADRTLRAFRAFPPPARDAIRPWVQEMCDGMAAFAARQALARPDALQALDDEADLDRYCWYVAGTVGHLLTDLFRLQAGLDEAGHARLKALATDFGLGLQLTNIIKDVADDRRRGWSFVPRALCAACGTTPEDLQDPAHAVAARRVMDRLIAKAQGHLDRALDYCCALPRGQHRLRQFCLAPLYFAVRTLAAARRDPRLLDPGHKVKITRGAVYRTLVMGALAAPSNRMVRAYYRRCRNRR